MSTLFSFKQIIKALANVSMLLVCMIGITLLTASCSTVSTKQTASNDTAAAKDKSEKEYAVKIKQKLECRYLEVTGTRFKSKTCKSKETWAAIDKKNKDAADDLVRTVNDQAGIPGASSANGTTNDAMSSTGGAF